jgi:NADH:ubiquinone oxidoreductase subunit E
MITEYLHWMCKISEDRVKSVAKFYEHEWQNPV